MGTGQAFVKWLRPAGCVLFLGMFILVTALLFTAKGSPVEGYTPTESSQYYAEHLDELRAELEENLLPKLDIAGADIEVRGDRLLITAEAGDLQTLRLAVIHYYDQKLFEFAEWGINN